MPLWLALIAPTVLIVYAFWTQRAIRRHFKDYEPTQYGLRKKDDPGRGEAP
jgi:hypothetical protein